MKILTDVAQLQKRQDEFDDKLRMVDTILKALNGDMKSLMDKISQQENWLMWTVGIV
jgi:peptidoglycan hydrolase CwlO-like protein